jgi:hypothetical protein
VKRVIERPIDLRFYKWQRKLIDPEANLVARTIPAMFVWGSWLAISCYHGGCWKALFFIARHEIHSAIVLRWHTFLIWICDRAGWSKIYEYPETETMLAHLQRHGRKCSGSPNCSDMDCIGRSIPRWFKVITRWDKI